MSTNVTFNGIVYAVPSEGERDWAGSTGVDGLLISLANNSFKTDGGNFFLLADVDFGPTAGLKSIYYKSRASDVAQSGVVRLGNTEIIAWRDFADASDLELGVNTSDELTFNGNPIVPSTPLASGKVVITEAASGQLTTGNFNYLLDQILVPDGTVALPAYSFNSDPDTGLYLEAGTMRLGFGGAQVVRFGSTSITSEVKIALPDGTAPSPTLTFADDQNTGIYSPANDEVAVAVAGVQALHITATAHQFFGGPVRFTNGTVALPSMAFGSDTDTGLYLSTTNQVSVASGGVQFVQVGATDVRVFKPFLVVQDVAGSDASVRFLNSNVAASSGLVLSLETASSAAGDAYIRFQAAGQASIGMDNSDADKVKFTHDIDLNSEIVAQYEADLTWRFVGNDVHVQRTNIAGDVILRVYNLDNTSNSSNAVLKLECGGSSGGDPKVVFTGSGTDSWSLGMDNNDVDAFVISSGSTLGTNNWLRINNSSNAIGIGKDNSSSGVLTGGLWFHRSTTIGSNHRFTIENLDTTNVASGSELNLRVEGSGAGDPIIVWTIDTVGQHYHMGIDNNVSDNLIIGTSATIGGGTTAITITPAGVVTIPSFAPSFTTLQLADGSAAAPSYSFSADTDTGIYRVSANRIGISSGGGLVYDAGTADQQFYTVVRFADGTVTLPGISFGSDTDTGIYLSAGTMRFAKDGVQAFRVASTAVTYEVPINLPDGTVGAPAIRFTNDQNTGIYTAALDEMSFATGGVERFRIDDGQVTQLSSLSGAQVRFTIANSSNTAGSDAVLRLSTPVSGGDAYIYFEGLGQACIGMDNSDADIMLFSHGATINSVTVGSYNDTTWTTLVDHKFNAATYWDEITTPTTPATNDWGLYFKTDGLYMLDDTGLETQVAAPGGGSNAYYAHYWMSGATATPTLTNNTILQLDFDTSVEDVSSRVTTGAAWKYTCIAGGDGVYQVISRGAIAGSTTGDRLTYLYKNGVVEKRFEQRPAPAGTGSEAMYLVCFVRLVATDFISVRYFQNSGGNRNFNNSGQDRAWVQIRRVGN